MGAIIYGLIDEDGKIIIGNSDFEVVGPNNLPREPLKLRFRDDMRAAVIVATARFTKYCDNQNYAVTVCNEMGDPTIVGFRVDNNSSFDRLGFSFVVYR